MIDLNNYIVKEFPYSDHKKVDDLIQYEGPILSLFINSSSQFYLYYWVDDDESFHRWLIARVDIESLVGYLDGKVSLHSILTDADREYILIADQNRDYEFVNSYLIQSSLIFEDYLPEKESFFESNDISDSISKILDLEELNDNLYLQSLRGDAIYLKLASTESKFKKTLTVTDIVDFLRKVDSSFGTFSKYDFETSFLEYFNDTKKLSNYYNKQIKEEINLRPVQLSYSSFGIGLSIDRLGRVKETKEIINWKKQILKKFDDEVLSIDDLSDEAIDEIKGKMDDDTRAKVYDPIIKIYNNPKVSFYKTDRNFSVKKRVKSISPVRKDQLVTKKVVEKPEGTELVSIVVEKPVGTDINKIRNISQYLLFSRVIDSFEYSFDGIENKNYRLNLSKDIEAVFTVDGDVHQVVLEVLNILVKTDNKESAIQQFQEEVISKYNHLREKKDLSEAEKVQWSYFEDHVIEWIQLRGD